VRWWGAIAFLVIGLMGASPLAAQHPFLLTHVPRFLDESDRVLLLLESRSSGTPFTVRVLVELDPVTSRRWLRVSSAGRTTPLNLTISCDGKTRDLPLTHAFAQAEPRMAVYALADALADWLLVSSTCVLTGVEGAIPLPLDMIRASWRDRAPEVSPGIRLLATIERVFGPGDFSVRIDSRLERVRCAAIEALSTLRVPRVPGKTWSTVLAPGIEGAQGGTLMLEFDILERDREGRLLAYVYIEDKLLNAELLRAGLARAAVTAPNIRHRELFLRLENEARTARRGFWGAGSAVAVFGHGRPVVRNERER
jgi:micrococcal nuclease